MLSECVCICGCVHEQAERDVEERLERMRKDHISQEKSQRSRSNVEVEKQMTELKEAQEVRRLLRGVGCLACTVSTCGLTELTPRSWAWQVMDQAHPAGCFPVGTAWSIP